MLGKAGTGNRIGSKIYRETHIKLTPNEPKTEAKDKGKQVKKLTWLQKMWAEVPNGKTKEWVKSVYTQETDWGDQGEMMWKQIVKDGGLEAIKKQTEETINEETIECGRSTEHLVKRHPEKADTNTYFTEFKIREQRYPSYMENNDYQLLNRKSAKDSIEKELYERMVKAAVKLNRIFPSVRGMTDAVCVVGASNTG